jgi:hypothetical protein
VTVLAVVVALLAVVTAGHLLLTFALIRRVRVLQERGGHADEPVPVPPAGSVVGPFSAATTSGGVVTDADVADGLVVFVSPTCEPCQKLVDGLLRDRQERPAAVFVAGEQGPETMAFAAKVAPLGEVAVVTDEGGAVGAFGVTAFPTVVRVAGGVVESAGIRMSDLGPRRAAPARP